MSRTGKKETRPAWMRSVKLVRFIKELSKHGNVSQALRSSKSSRSWVYEKRQLDLDFSDAFDDAKKCGLEVLIDEAHRRAYEGVEEAKTVAGKREVIRKYSDTLLMFLIKQADPSYREAYKIEHEQSGSRPFLFQMQLDPRALAEAQKQMGAQ